MLIDPNCVYHRRHISFMSPYVWPDVVPGLTTVWICNIPCAGFNTSSLSLLVWYCTQYSFWKFWGGKVDTITFPWVLCSVHKTQCSEKCKYDSSLCSSMLTVVGEVSFKKISNFRNIKWFCFHRFYLRFDSGYNLNCYKKRPGYFIIAYYIRHRQWQDMRT